MSCTRPLPVVALTMGDPAGIGPEICLDVLSDPRVLEFCVPQVFGDAGVLRRVAAATGKPMGELLPREGGALRVPGIVDFAVVDAASVVPGAVDAACGRAAFQIIEAAIGAAMEGRVDAVATAPIHKEALNAGGCAHPGHTEIFASLTGAGRVCMMLTSSALTCSLVTTHLGIGEVAGALTSEKIFDAIELTHHAMLRMRGHVPKLVVNGLNPHAGEGGLFGAGEEETILAPAILRARAAGYDVEGPVSPDTAFLPERREGTDAYVCMYHDQGLIPLKMLAFDTAVNVTLGLPIIRTSVDHGTAFDLAWKGRAKSSSLFEAVRLAARLASSA